MLFLGHMGIGSKLASPWAARLPYGALLLGTVLPDLIDKPLYYALFWVARAQGAQLGLINNSRTLGHTGLLLICVAGFAALKRSRWLAALVIGMSTHVLLDNVCDVLFERFFPIAAEEPTHSALVALLWPLYSFYFPRMPFHTFGAHLQRSFNPLSIGGELLGGAILAWDYWKRSHESEIVAAVKALHRKIRKKRS